MSTPEETQIALMEEALRVGLEVEAQPTAREVVMMARAGLTVQEATWMAKMDAEAQEALRELKVHQEWCPVHGTYEWTQAGPNGIECPDCTQEEEARKC